MTMNFYLPATGTGHKALSDAPLDFRAVGVIFGKAAPRMAPVVLFVQRHGIIELAVFQELDDDLARPQLLHIVLPELDDPAVDGILGRGGGIFRPRMLGAGRHVVDPHVVL